MLDAHHDYTLQNFSWPALARCRRFRGRHAMSDTRLIERWLPIAEMARRAHRERRSMTALPPMYYLHVW